MTAARKRPSAPALDLFVAPPRPRPVEVAAPAEPDFTAPVERIRLDGHRYITRTKVYSGHEYRAWERSDVHFYGAPDPTDPGGRVGHRGDGKADSCEYCLWVWDTEDGPRGGSYGKSRPGWHTEQMPALPVDMRHWRPDAVPGTRPIDPSLVDEIRRRYL